MKTKSMAYSYGLVMIEKRYNFCVNKLSNFRTTSLKLSIFVRFSWNNNNTHECNIQIVMRPLIIMWWPWNCYIVITTNCGFWPQKPHFQTTIYLLETIHVNHSDFSDRVTFMDNDRGFDDTPFALLWWLPTAPLGNRKDNLHFLTNIMHSFTCCYKT